MLIISYAVCILVYGIWSTQKSKFSTHKQNLESLSLYCMWVMQSFPQWSSTDSFPLNSMANKNKLELKLIWGLESCQNLCHMLSELMKAAIISLKANYHEHVVEKLYWVFQDSFRWWAAPVWIDSSTGQLTDNNHNSVIVSWNKKAHQTPFPMVRPMVNLGCKPNWICHQQKAIPQTSSAVVFF